VKLAGAVLDIYDDPTGVVLKQQFPHPEMLPAMVKEGHVLSREELAVLPDEDFALVLHDNGTPQRKYAMADPANLALSVVYFLRGREVLPEEATKVAAARLVAGCYTHGIEPPPQLFIEAGEKLADLWPSSSLRGLTEEKKPDEEPRKSYPDHFPDPQLRAQAEQLQQRSDELDLHGDELEVQQQELRTAAKRLEMTQVQRIKNSQGEKIASLWVSGSLRSLTGNGSSDCVPCNPSDRPYEAYFTDPDLKEQAKALMMKDDELSLKRDEIGLQQQELEIASKKLELAQVQRFRQAKTSAQPEAAAVPPQVVTTGQTPAPETVVKQASIGDCLLVVDGEGRFRCRNYGEIEKAAAYFEQFWTEFDLARRREFCTNLMTKAAAVGYPLPEIVEKYGSREYDPLMSVYFAARQDAVQGNLELAEMYGRLEKVAAAGQVDPDVMASALYDLDREAGLDRFYDAGIPDPIYSLFGHTKIAATAGEEALPTMWTWDNGLGDSVNEHEINQLINDTVSRELFAEQFDSDFVTQFSKNPIQVFDSLPDPTKAIIARLAAPSN